MLKNEETKSGRNRSRAEHGGQTAVAPRVAQPRQPEPAAAKSKGVSEIADIDLSEGRLTKLRLVLWRCRTQERRNEVLALMAEAIETAIASGADRWQLAAELREAGYSHPELGMLRKWAILRDHFELDEVLVALGAEIRKRV